MRNSWFVATAVLAMVAVGCGKSSSSSSAPAATSAPAAAAAHVSVNVDGKNADPAESFTAYYPREATVHPGDTVDFKLQDTGEPHTVTLGTLADAAIKVVSAATPAQQNGPPPPEDAKLPHLLPQGPGDAVQSAAVPCFLDTGEPPPADACPTAQQTQSDFTGTQTYYNSGWLAADKVFSVKLAPTIKAGTYQYMCLLHRETMSGKITVVDKSISTPSAADQAATGAKELEADKATLQPALGPLQTGTNPDLGPFLPKDGTVVLAGALVKGQQHAAIDAFGPKQVSIPVGGSVTWAVLGPHTIAFNAPEDAKGIRTPGTTHLNRKAGPPTGGPGFKDPDRNAPPGPPNFTVTDAGPWDGTGFHNSGVGVSFPPSLLSYKLTFTKAGTYTYKCLIHDNMEGSVKVG